MGWEPSAQLLPCSNSLLRCCCSGHFCVAMMHCLTNSLKEGRTGSQLQRIQSMVVLKASQRDSVQGIAAKKQGWGTLFCLSPYPIYTVYTPSPWAGITLEWSFSFCLFIKASPQAQPEVYFNLLGNSKSSHADHEGEPSRYSDWMKQWNAFDWKLLDCTLSDFKMALWP